MKMNVEGDGEIAVKMCAQISWKKSLNIIPEAGLPFAAARLAILTGSLDTQTTAPARQLLELCSLAF